MVCTLEFTSLTFVNDAVPVLDEANVFGMGSCLLDICIQIYQMAVCYDVLQ